MNIIMLGAPGAGKGTISVRLEVKYDIPHISTGDIFRENIKNNTELGKKAKEYIDKGVLVPDEITIGMMVDRLNHPDCEHGYILDGFPRNISQAKAFENELNKYNKKIDLVLLVEADEERIIHRLSGRRVCSKCGATYHIETLKPKIDNVCDRCNSTLEQRKDDKEEVIRQRIDVYKEQTMPLIQFYEKEGILKTIDGFENIDTIMEKIYKMV